MDDGTRVDSPDQQIRRDGIGQVNPVQVKLTFELSKPPEVRVWPYDGVNLVPAPNQGPDRARPDKAGSPRHKHRVELDG
jgi:hypothetical protein